MIRIPTEAELVDAAEFVWNCCVKPASASYPLPETRGRIETSFRRTLVQENCTLLCSFDPDGMPDGVLEYFVLPDERYLQTTAFCADSDEVAQALLNRLIERCPGCTANLGFSAENGRMARILTQNGFTIAERSADLRLAKAAFTPDPGRSLLPVRVTERERARYAPLHERIFPDNYWNAERLFSSPDDWIVCMLCAQDMPCGGVYLRVFGSAAEVFGLALLPEYDSPDAARALLSAALCTLYAENEAVNGVVYFAGENDTSALRAAKDSGFTLFGRYRLYTRAL